MLTIDPESARSRLLRMLTAHRLNRPEIALTDGRWLVTRQPAGVDLDRVQRLLATLEADR